jgi:hypothetical protein
MRCPAIPSNDAPATIHGGGATLPDVASHANTGRSPNDNAYGAQLSTVFFNPALYVHAEETATAMTAVSAPPSGTERTTLKPNAITAATITTRGDTTPATMGFPRRPAAASRRLSR